MSSVETCWSAAHIGDLRLARTRAYIYCGYSRKVGVAYVGMTIGRRGVLGRWADHLSRDIDSSSFRRRLYNWDESAWSRLDDLVIFWADIGDAPEFLTLETSHRESVEYLVQREIRSIVAGGMFPLRVISVVRPNYTVDLPIVRDAAKFVLNAFRQHYENLG
jgi:hypothetical protein